MFILGLDTTQAACSAAVYDTLKKRISGRVWRSMPRGHAENLPQIIKQTLDQAGLSFKDIGKLAVTTGPGSFTGVRIGVSAARGFALALDLPLVGINSLEAIAANVEGFETKTILAAFDARRDEVYTQMFAHGQALSEPEVLSITDAARLATKDQKTEVVGTATELLSELNIKLLESTASALPDAAIVVKIAAHRQAQTSVQPLYLRKADAKAQKPLLAIKPGKVEMITATPEHSQVLAKIHRQGFSSPWSPDNINGCLTSAGTSGHIAIDTKGEPLGFIIYRDVARECEILTLAVRLDARRRSVATFLLTAMLNNGEGLNRQKIFLEVSENNFPAQSLYKKHGYTNCGVRKKYYTENDGQKYDAIIMQQVL